MFLNFLRKLFIVDYISEGVRPDLEEKAIEIALEAKNYEFKEGEAYQYDKEYPNKKIYIGFDTIYQYSKKHKMHCVPGTNPENGFDTLALYPKRAV